MVSRVECKRTVENQGMVMNRMHCGETFQEGNKESCEKPVGLYCSERKMRKLTGNAMDNLIKSGKEKIQIPDLFFGRNVRLLKVKAVIY